MRTCLTADVGSYYAGSASADHDDHAGTPSPLSSASAPAPAADELDRDQFGARGDFVTSPEISQVFGELVGIWFVAEWMSQGQPARGVDHRQPLHAVFPVTGRGSITAL